MATKKKVYPWEKYYPEGINWDTEIEAQPVYTLLDKTAAAYPENHAIDFYGRYYTYKEVQDLSDRMAKGLQKAGIGKGDKVGLFMPNCPYYVIAYFAVLKTGATAVNYNPLYTISELQHQVQDSATTMMVTLNLAQFHEKTGNLLQTTCLERIVVCDIRDALTPSKRFFFNLLKKKQIGALEYGRIHLDFNKLIDNDGSYKPADIDPEKDMALIQYTGGTTGVPKGAVLTHASVYTNASQISAWFVGLEEGNEKMLAVLPFFHVFGMTAVLLLSVARGCEMVMHSRFDISAVLKDIVKKKVTLMIGVPSIYNAICNYQHINAYKLKSLKVAISGGAPLPVEVKNRFEELTGSVLCEGYGLSEASPVVAVNPLFGESRDGSVGMPLPGTIVEIRATEGRRKLCPVKEIGEVCVIGPQVMQGYYKMDEETKNVIRSGRLHTGDMGYLDKDGYIYVVDRIKDLVICNGYNVYPREIEELLYEHTSINEAAVIAVEDEKCGQIAKAYIVLRVGEELGEVEVVNYLKKKLAAYKVPAVYEFCDSLPKTLIGKVDKKALVAQDISAQKEG